MLVKPDPSFFEGSDAPSPLKRMIRMLLDDDPSMTVDDALELLGEAHRAFNWGGSLHAL